MTLDQLHAVRAALFYALTHPACMTHAARIGQQLACLDQVILYRTGLGPAPRPETSVARSVTPAAWLPASVQKARPLQGRVNWRGLQISIENRIGSVRQGVDPNGRPWRTYMQRPYGYIRRTNGLDDEHVDCFIGPQKHAPMVYIITTRRPTDWRTTDEQKCMLNFVSAAAAKQCFLRHYDDVRHFGSMTAMTVPQFLTAVQATWDHQTPHPLRGTPVEG